MLSWVTWVQCIVPSWVFRRSKVFSLVYSWVPNFFSWVFRGFKFFSRGYFVGPRFYYGIFHGSKIFSCRYFVGPKFYLVSNFVIFSCWWHKKKRRRKKPSHFIVYSKSISTIVNYAHIRKALHLLNYLYYYAALVCTSFIFSHLFLGNRISSLVIEIYS